MVRIRFPPPKSLTGVGNRIRVGGPERLNPQLAASKIQCGRPAGREVPVPSPLATAHRTHEDLVVAHHHPDHDRTFGVFLSPDRDFPEIARRSAPIGRREAACSSRRDLRADACTAHRAAMQTVA
jgi:hypothetical protein